MAAGAVPFMGWYRTLSIARTRSIARTSVRVASTHQPEIQGCPEGKERVMRINRDIVGLGGFTISGLLFVASAVRSGDIFSLAGSIVWIISCLGWIAAIVRSRGS